MSKKIALEDNRFKQLRKQTKLTQTKVALALGIEASAVSKWECGRTLPDQSVLPKLAKLYNTTIFRHIKKPCISRASIQIVCASFSVKLFMPAYYLFFITPIGLPTFTFSFCMPQHFLRLYNHLIRSSSHL